MKACVIGANRGIGLELTKQLVEKGATVYATCRSASDALTRIKGAIVIEGIETTSEASMKSLKEAIGDNQLDLLVVNAGILTSETLDNFDLDAMRLQFEVNALGSLRVVKTLLNNLGEGAKIGLVTSRMGSIADNTSGSRYGYRMSKAALNIAGVSLAHDLAPRGISVALLHPGYVRTAMTGGRGYVDADEAAADLLNRMDELNLEKSGVFWHAKGEVLPW